MRSPCGAPVAPGANSIVGGTGGIALTLSGYRHTAHLVGPPLITAVAGRSDFKIAQNERLPDLGQSPVRDPTVRGSNGASPAFDAARRTPAGPRHRARFGRPCGAGRTPVSCKSLQPNKN